MLLFTMSRCVMSFFLVVYISNPICYTFLGSLLNMFPTSCVFLLYIEMIFFFLHCAPKPQAVVVTTLCFISQRRLIFHAIYLFNNNKYILSLLHSLKDTCFGNVFRIIPDLSSWLSLPLSYMYKAEGSSLNLLVGAFSWHSSTQMSS